MLHFFRKIRRDLLANSQFFKYLKYAIGEIVLVVLGILIALQINNRNEERKEQDKFNQILVDVEKEIVDNISFARETIHGFAQYDSLCLNFFIDSVRFADNIYLYRRLFGGSVKSLIRDDAFQKLNQLIRLSTEQEAMRDKLIDFKLGNGEIEIDDHSRKMTELKEARLEIFKKHEWCENWQFYKYDDRFADFFTMNDEGRNLVLENFTWVTEYRESLQHYDSHAIPVFKSISRYLDSLGLEHNDSSLFEYDPKNYKHYLGKYNAVWCSHKDFVFDDSVIVSTEKGKLFWTAYRQDGNGRKMEISPINKYHFRTPFFAGIYHLEINEHGEVSGITFSAGPEWVYSLEKVR
ncbi:hypothetical protein LCM02_08225 [Lutimonas saemankumensis]|uniref:hypothetical protein n=1 Tax=Lutimonas saemankumensis TaxID=483016 RepID=UPI001CD72BC4|nr:hypothetical protein [Lutimonas saemankumensis]MCA0932434.1 hypothetical protein [Lutimonas saemankumensis]